MLMKKELFEGMEEKYIPMLKMVSIPDFTKCIAQYSGIEIKDLSDDIIKKYLQKWAINKFRFFELLGGKLQYDTKIKYVNRNKDIEQEILGIANEFPVYSPWILGFENIESNKIDLRDVNYQIKSYIKEYFPHFSAEGSTLTHFFKSCLNAPDELVTRIGGMFENETVEANYTISIDPVDMMLASENPYKWVSCYRLELDNESSHADGCLAAVLDTSSLITYVWNNEGKFNLYQKYDFKNIRYKRMREWISISPNMTSVHFNEIYPGKDRYDEELRKILRNPVEEIIAKFLNKNNLWIKSNASSCDRDYLYGYGEFDDYRIWTLKGEEDERWYVYNEPIEDPANTGATMPGTDDDNEYEYNGCGLIYDNFCYQGVWCDYCDNYCNDVGECCEYECENCHYWQQEHPNCDLTNEPCEDPDWSYTEDGVMESNEDHCHLCPMWKACHQKEEEKAEESDKSDPKDSHTITIDTSAYYAPYSNSFTSVLDDYILTWGDSENRLNQ